MFAYGSIVYKFIIPLRYSRGVYCHLLFSYEPHNYRSPIRPPIMARTLQVYGVSEKSLIFKLLNK